MRNCDVKVENFSKPWRAVFKNWQCFRNTLITHKPTIKTIYSLTLFCKKNVVSSKTVVPWNDLRNRWVKCSSKKNKIELVKRYFNTFATKNPGNIFITAKKFSDCTMASSPLNKCSVLNRQLERNFGLAGSLDEALPQEVSRNDWTFFVLHNLNILF